MESTFKFTNVFYNLVNSAQDNRYLILYGGSSSSKSISILQYLTLYAFKYKNKRITISSESLPVIKKTVFADWKQLVMGNLFDYSNFNKTEMTYRFPTGTVFNFIPADDEARWHGLRQDIVYFDELYYIKKSIYDQADIRTKNKVISSFNPVSPFYIQDNFNDDNTKVIHSTYKDNQYLDDAIIKALEKRIKKDKNFADVYIRGLFGSLEGLIFKEETNWNIIKEFPEDFKWKVYGMDFGFSIDPTTLIEIGYVNGEIYAQELIWETGLTNPDIYDKITDISDVIIADSAEAKSIQELNDLGSFVEPAIKGPDSIRFGLNTLKQFKINVHYESINLIKELRNYKWHVTKQGEQTGKPIDNWNHGIDALRYGITWQLTEATTGEYFVN